MKTKEKCNSYERCEFLKLVATAAISGPIMMTAVTSQTSALSASKQTIHRNERPTMSYRKLGRTNFWSSRLVFGCGAALMGGGAPRLLQRAFEAGINHFDENIMAAAMADRYFA